MKKVLALLLSLTMLLGILPVSVLASALESSASDNVVMFSVSGDADGKIYYSGTKNVGKNGLGYTTPGLLRNSDNSAYNSGDGSAYLYADEIDGEKMWKITFNANEDGTHVMSKGGRTYIYPFNSHIYDSTGTAIPTEDIETLGDNYADADEFTHLAIRLRLVDDGTGRAKEGATHSISMNLFAADAKHDVNWPGWYKTGEVYFYDINTGSKTKVTTNTVDLPLGFDGYLIYPHNAVNLLSGATTKLSEMVGFHIFPHWGCTHSGLKETDNWVGSELYIGDMILTKNINSFEAEYGIPEFELVSEGTSITVKTNNIGALYSFDKDAEEWLTLEEFNASAVNLKADTEYTVYSKFENRAKIVSQTVKTISSERVIFAVTDDADGKLYYSGSKAQGKNGLGYTQTGMLKKADGVSYTTGDGSAYLFADVIDGEKMWKIDFNTTAEGTHAKSKGGGTYIYPFYSNLYDSSGVAIPTEDIETLGDNIASADDYTHLAIRIRLADDGSGRAKAGATHSISMNLLAAAGKDGNFTGWKNSGAYFYDVNTGEKTPVTKASMDIPLGFDGYIIYPQNTVMVAQGSSAKTSFAEFVKFHILIHWGCTHSDSAKATDNWVGTELYIGDMILTSDINEFNLNHGAPIFDVTANDTAITVMSDDANALYALDKNAEEWLPLAEFNAKANNLNRNTKYTVYSKYPAGTKILSKDVTTTNTGIMWNLLDVPEEENFYNYKGKYIGWHTNLSMWRDKDPFTHDTANYRVGDDSGVYTKKVDDEYFIILNPNEVLNDSGKIKEANGGVCFNTFSGRGLDADGNAKKGVPEGIDAFKSEYFAIRFRIMGGEADQYSSVSFYFSDNGYLDLANSFLMDKTTGHISNPNLDGSLLGIKGEFDGWLMIPWRSLYYYQRNYIQSTGANLHMYFHTELCGSNHGSDTSSDWQNKVFCLGNAMLVDDGDLFMETFGKKMEATDGGMIFAATDMHAINGAYEQMPNTFEATFRFPKDYPSIYRGGIITSSVYELKGTALSISTNGNPVLSANNGRDSSNKTISYTYKFDKVNVFTGEFVHLAIVNDQTANTVTCYVDGVAVQTLEGCVPEIKSEIAGVIGGSLTNSNSNFFTGELKSVALYSEARTAEQIAEDVISFANGAPLAAWDLTQAAVDGKIKDLGENGHDITLGTTYFSENTPSSEYDYSFALVGDTQIVNRYHADKFPGIYDWILENKENKKIEYVIGLGDITDADADREWAAAVEAHKKLDGVIPYALVIGNHDGTEKFNSSFSNTPYSTSFDGQFDERLENTYREFVVGGVRYLIITLDIGPSDAEMAWASEIIEAHPDHNVIIATHVFLAPDGNPALPKTGYNGAKMWENLMGAHSNIVLVVSGHFSSNIIATTQREGVNGNIVTQMLVDPQGLDNDYGATGMVTLLNFSEGGSKIKVETVSTVNGLYYLPYNQFEITVPVNKCEYEITEEVAATCTEDGHTVYTCKNCGETYTEETKATGHKTEILEDKAPTCTEAGIFEEICLNCDYYNVTEFEALGHNYVAGETVPATPSAQGYTVYTCSRCGATENRDFVDYVEPSNKVTGVTVAPTDIGFVVTWDAFEGATGYYVRVRNSENTTNIANKNVGNVTEYEFKLGINGFNASYDEEYIIQVIAYVGNVYQKYADADGVVSQMVITNRVVDVKTTPYGLGAEVTFRPVEGANKYWVYVRNAADDSAVYTTSTTTTSAKLVNNMIGGTEYYVQIVAFKDNTALDTRANALKTKFTAPYVLPSKYNVAAKTATTFSITWDAVAGATTYFVQVRTMDDAPVRTVTVSGKTIAAVSMYSDASKLSANTTYKFRIAATINGVTTGYGDWMTYTTGDYEPVTVTAEHNTETGKVKIAWTDLVDSHAVYLYRIDAEGNRKYFKYLENGETSYTIKAPASGTYSYGVVTVQRNMSGDCYNPIAVSNTITF